MARAILEWERYLTADRTAYQWVLVQDPHYLARSLEILSMDIPEDDIASLVTRMPYLMVLFQRPDLQRNVPIEPMFAMLSVLNHSGLVTLLRQTSDRNRLCVLYEMEAEHWEPMIFMLGGKPDLDLPLADHANASCRFF